MATDLIDLAGHEQVAFCTDPDTGLRAIIALHDTSLGPGLGGTRFHPYSSTDQALADVLRLSRAMTSKNAVAGLDHGGGKAVIIGDPRRDKTPELLRAYGRFVESLGGRYVTACDVGTYVADMDVVGETTRWATGRSPERGGAGDSSVLTAYGVFEGMRAAAQHVWGEPTLAGRRVAHRRRRQGRPAAHRPPPRGRRRGGGHRRQHGCRARPAARAPPGARRRRPRRAGAPGGRRVQPQRARRAPSTSTPSRRCAPGWSAAAPTTSWSARARAAPPTGCWPAASPTRPTSSSTPVASSRSATSCTGSTCSGPASARRRSSSTPSQVLRDADAAGVSPAVAADRLAERRVAGGGQTPWLPGDRVGAAAR